MITRWWFDGRFLLVPIDTASCLDVFEEHPGGLMKLGFILLMLGLACVRGEATLFASSCGTGIEAGGVRVAPSVGVTIPRELLESPAVFPFTHGRSAFLVHLQEDPSLARRILYRWYGVTRATSMLGRLREEEKFLIPLLTDPGIASRLDDFLMFVRDPSRSLSGKHLSQIRNAFGKFLGTSRWYTTTSQTARHVRRQGVSAFALQGDFALKADTLERYVTEDGPLMEISRNISGKNSRTLTIPLTQDLEEAKTLAKRGDTLVVEVFLPVLSTIPRNGFAPEGGNGGSRSYVLFQIRPAQVWRCLPLK
jgi:hypothetical protein